MCSDTVGWVRKSASAAREKLPSSATFEKISRRRKSTGAIVRRKRTTGPAGGPSSRRESGEADQWQEHPPPQHPPPPPPIGMDATGPSLRRPNTESFFITLSLAHAGHATAVPVVCTYFSKSPPQPRQRYS